MEGRPVLVYLRGLCVGSILDLIFQFVCVQLQLLFRFCRSLPPSSVTWYHKSGSRMYRLESVM